MIRRAVLIILAMLIPSAAASAQRACKKGIPCGGSCISANKVCHVGEAPPPPPQPPAAPLSTSELARRGLLSTTAVLESPDSMWVGSVDGVVYYRATCATARKLSDDERIYFPTEEEAFRRGYRRSRAKNC